MLKDITIGQYIAGNSFVHRLDPRAKLIFTVIYIVLLFCCESALSYVLCVGLLFALYMAAGIKIKIAAKSIKAILPLVLFTSVLNMLFIGGDALFTLGFISISKQGVVFAVTMAIRIMVLICGTSLLTYTTTPIALTDALERLMAPLAKLHFPVHELSMMMTITLRFIPTLIDETEKIMSAQKSRGADLDSGGLMDRIKALIPIIIPLFVSAFRRADELALAMECRCYNGGEGRTKMNVLKFKAADVIVLIFGVLLIAAVWALNLLPF